MNQTKPLPVYLQSKTPERKILNNSLNSQSKTDLFYAFIKAGPEGGRFGPFTSVDEFKEKRQLSGNLYDATAEDLNQILGVLSNLEDGKELLILALKCEDDCSVNEIIESAATLNHEEFHVTTYLNGTFTSPEQDHMKYYGVYSYLSPSSEKEVLTNSKYKNSLAYKRIIQFIKELSEDPDKFIAPQNDEDEKE